LGEEYHTGYDNFQYTFGCVKQETNLFYSQQADGILGMSMQSKYGSVNLFRPIYEVMHEYGLIE
jgi:hypothetical protein